MDKQALMEATKNYKRMALGLAEKNAYDDMYRLIRDHLPTIRPEIMQFAIEMEKAMACHVAEKGDSWKDKGFMLESAYGAVLGHNENFKTAWYKEDSEAMMHEAVDIANYWMMIYHKAKGD